MQIRKREKSSNEVLNTNIDVSRRCKSLLRCAAETSIISRYLFISLRSKIFNAKYLTRTREEEKSRECDNHIKRYRDFSLAHAPMWRYTLHRGILNFYMYLAEFFSVSPPRRYPSKIRLLSARMNIKRS